MTSQPIINFSFSRGREEEKNDRKRKLSRRRTVATRYKSHSRWKLNENEKTTKMNHVSRLYQVHDKRCVEFFVSIVHSMEIEHHICCACANRKWHQRHRLSLIPSGFQMDKVLALDNVFPTCIVSLHKSQKRISKSQRQTKDTSYSYSYSVL